MIPCKPASDAGCSTKFIRVFGRKAFRRPLEPEEIALYQDIFKTGKNFLSGAQGVIEAMLQSPSFVFWLDETPNPKWKPYAQASRLAYFIWNTAPDDTLLDSAARGALNSSEGIERVTRRMLGDPKAREGLDEFVAEWMRFDRVMTASRERRLYPLFSRELARSMTEECRRFIADLVWNDRSFMEAFTAKFSFINSDLAAVYKVAPPARDFDRVEFPPESELDTNLPPVEESKPVTNRERLAMHAGNQMCAGCHNLIDPIGFGFEKFDAIGMRREKHKLLFYPQLTGVAARRAKPKEVELELNTKGRVAGIQGSDFSSPRELGELLARTPQCQECLVKQLFRYMSGRQDTAADRPVLNRAYEAFRKSDYRFKELMVALVNLREFPDSGRTTNVASNH